MIGIKYHVPWMYTPDVSEYTMYLNTSLKELFEKKKFFCCCDVVRKAISKEKKIFFGISSYYLPYSLLKHNLGEIIIILEYISLNCFCFAYIQLKVCVLLCL